jgi:hypothetical protein
MRHRKTIEGNEILLKDLQSRALLTPGFYVYQPFTRFEPALFIRVTSASA